MSSENLTCEQRIGDEMRDRMAGIRAYAESDRTEDDEYGHLPEPLAIEPEIVVHIQLSTGGPADGFRLTYQSGDLVRGEYYFQDWFDGATRTLDNDELEMVADVYGAEYTAYPEGYRER